LQPSYFHIHSLFFSLFLFWTLQVWPHLQAKVSTSPSSSDLGTVPMLQVSPHLQAKIFASSSSSGHMGRCPLLSTKLLVAGHSSLSVQLTVSELFTQFPYGHTALVYTHQASSSASLAGVPASAFLAVSVCFAVSHTAHQSRAAVHVLLPFQGH
jgi:hypothetical protein